MRIMAKLKTVTELEYFSAKTKNVCKWKIREYPTPGKGERKRERERRKVGR